MARRLAIVLVVIVGAGGFVAIRLLAGSEHVLVRDAAFPAAMASLPDGSLLYGERLTGRVRSVDPSGRLDPRPVAHVSVSTGGQRGLLGLAVDGRGRVFACWTDPGGRIEVGRVIPGPLQVVWRGPQSSNLADGGHLAFAPDGSLVVGIGELERPALVPDPRTPNGKILALNPDGPPDQTPRVISGGWHNPFAFTFTRDGHLWVADNAPGELPERLTQGDRPGAPVTVLEPHTAPSSLLALSSHTLLLCSFGYRTLQRFRIDPSGRAGAVGGPVARDCELSVETFGPGRVAYSDRSTIRTVTVSP